MIKQLRAFIAGESYWKVIFQNGKTLSELDTRPYMGTDKVIRVRAVEWLEDIIGSGDLRNIKEAMLCTPQGTAHFTVSEPYTAFQFSRGTLSMLDGGRIKNLQVVGVVTDQETGACECAVWDQQTRRLYTMHNNVRQFVKWREGVIDIGMLNLKALDLRGVPA